MITADNIIDIAFRREPNFSGIDRYRIYSHTRDRLKSLKKLDNILDSLIFGMGDPDGPEHRITQSVLLAKLVDAIHAERNEINAKMLAMGAESMAIVMSQREDKRPLFMGVDYGSRERPTFLTTSAEGHLQLFTHCSCPGGQGPGPMGYDSDCEVHGEELGRIFSGKECTCSSKNFYDGKTIGFDPKCPFHGGEGCRYPKPFPGSGIGWATPV